MERPATDLAPAVDAAEYLVQHARPVPLMDEVRIDREDLRRAATEIRSALDRSGARPSEAHDFVSALERFERFGDGRPVPLTNQVRVNRDKAYDAIRAMRRNIPRFPS